MNLSNTSSVSFSDLISTIASYFGLNTRSAERERDGNYCHYYLYRFFLYFNLQGVGFSEISSKSLIFLDPSCRHADLTYFTFYSIVSTATVDI